MSQAQAQFQALTQQFISQGLAPAEAARKAQAQLAASSPGILSGAADRQAARAQEQGAVAPQNPFGLASQPIGPGILSTQPAPEQQGGAVATQPPQNPFGLGSQTPQAPGAGILASEPMAPPMAPPRAPPSGEGWADQITRGIRARAMGTAGDILAAPFKAAGGVIKDTLDEGAALGRELGMRAGGLNPGQTEAGLAIQKRAAELQAAGVPPAQAVEQARAEVLGGAPAAAPAAPPQAPVAPQAAPQAPAAPTTPLQDAIAASPRTAPAPAAPPQAPAAPAPAPAQPAAPVPATTFKLPASTQARRDTYAPIFTQVGEKHGIPPMLLEATAWAESGFNPRAQSGAGAKGFMQFMDGTAREYGVDVNDPASSVDGAARYYKKLLGMFGGDQSKAIAAYNWGEGNLQKAIKKYGDNWLAHAPEETQKHVAKINRYMGGDVGSPEVRAAEGSPVGYEEMPAPGVGVLSTGQGQDGTPPATGAAGEAGAAPQGEGPQGQGVLSSEYPKSRANEFMERIYSSPWKGALYNALAAIAEVDPYAHVNQLRQMDVDSRAEFEAYQQLHAPLDPYKAAQIKKIEYEIGTGLYDRQQRAAQGPGIKSSTWDPEAGAYRVLYEDGSTAVMPAAGEGYVPPSEIAVRKAQEAADLKRQGEARVADMDAQAAMAGLADVERLMVEGFETGAFGPITGNAAAGVIDKGLATVGSGSAKERVELRERARQNVLNQTLALSQQLTGVLTDRDMKLLIDSIPAASATESEWKGWLTSTREAINRALIKKGAGGGMTPTPSGRTTAQEYGQEPTYGAPQPQGGGDTFGLSEGTYNSYY